MKKQHGISLIVVLIALVIITFAAAAMLRSTDTSTLVAGNLTFKKAALVSGDAGTEAAIEWLNLHAAGADLHSDRPDDGYYATSADGCDLTGSATPDDPADDVQWGNTDPGADCHMKAFTPESQPEGVTPGYTVSYVINRMCNAAGDPSAAVSAAGTTMICSRSDVANVAASTQVGPTYSRRPFTGGAQTYYRITTRIEGPRNTVRYVQAFVVL
jgi:type IV pilus assembly protein PilX